MKTYCTTGSPAIIAALGRSFWRSRKVARSKNTSCRHLAFITCSLAYVGCQNRLNNWQIETSCSECTRMYFPQPGCKISVGRENAFHGNNIASSAFLRQVLLCLTFNASTATADCTHLNAHRSMQRRKLLNELQPEIEDSQSLELVITTGAICSSDLTSANLRFKLCQSLICTEIFDKSKIYRWQRCGNVDTQPNRTGIQQFTVAPPVALPQILPHYRSSSFS
ncbi:hypothetical protein CEXT_739891 [Caerostris extrusa]|uniref:Uncharacterized protein n=1 Tax=Caerostris extrusa TaxID=172846 RepID=A0AAV4TCN1_CAEEX|nr:hypothetical protein CEXT_739891 [Caerostris extrusa]